MFIFISHAAANSRLARALAAAVGGSQTDVRAFLSSRPGDIDADHQWMSDVEAALRSADAFVIVLTPESVLRPWVNFEAGAAWFARRRLVLVRIQALQPHEIPSPLSSRQIYALDKPDELAAIFDNLGLPLAGAAELAASFTSLGLETVRAGEDEPAWEGAEVEGVFYAWAGPLLKLQDRDAVPPPRGLLEIIGKRGLSTRWATVEKVAEHSQRGLAQVFATDRTSWRRPVLDRNRPLMVNYRMDSKSAV